MQTKYDYSGGKGGQGGRRRPTQCSKAAQEEAFRVLSSLPLPPSSPTYLDYPTRPIFLQTRSRSPQCRSFVADPGVLPPFLAIWKHKTPLRVHIALHPSRVHFLGPVTYMTDTYAKSWKETEPEQRTCESKARSRERLAKCHWRSETKSLLLTSRPTLSPPDSPEKTCVEFVCPRSLSDSARVWEGFSG
ncbi:hypothetical protein LZ32DRAFT_132745 [Colletotrichum eremochloae]|nr:hypothetical protein LZ32DRAFT_132745 [Colletotrichum eremochloae]